MLTKLPLPSVQFEWYYAINRFKTSSCSQNYCNAESPRIGEREEGLLSRHNCFGPLFPHFLDPPLRYKYYHGSIFMRVTTKSTFIQKDYASFIYSLDKVQSPRFFSELVTSNMPTQLLKTEIQYGNDTNSRYPLTRGLRFFALWTTGSPHKLCDRLYFEFIEAMYGNIENPRIIVLVSLLLRSSERPTPKPSNG